MGLISLIRASGRRRHAAAGLYRAILKASRDPAFYKDAAIPDTIIGRFEVLSAHLALVFLRMKDRSDDIDLFLQDLAGAFIKDMDRTMRELGLTDLRVGKKVTSLAAAFYGRVERYERSLAAEDPALAVAIVLEDLLDIESGGKGPAALLVDRYHKIATLELDDLRHGELNLAGLEPEEV